jgi:hypothetical protein
MKRFKANVEAGDYDAASTWLLQLPVDARVNILSYLTVPQIYTLSTANRSLRIWIDGDPRIWQMIFERNFPNVTIGDLRDSMVAATGQPIDDDFRAITLAHAFVLRWREIYGNNNFIRRRGDRDSATMTLQDGGRVLFTHVAGVIQITHNETNIPPHLSDIFATVTYNQVDNEPNVTTYYVAPDDTTLTYIAFRLFLLGYEPMFFRDGMPLVEQQCSVCSVCSVCATKATLVCPESGTMFCSESCYETIAGKNGGGDAKRKKEDDDDEDDEDAQFRARFRTSYAHFNCRSVQTFVVSASTWMAMPYFVDMLKATGDELVDPEKPGNIIFPILDHDPETFNEVLNVIKYSTPPPESTKNRYRLIAALNEFGVRYFEPPRFIKRTQYRSQYDVKPYDTVYYKGYIRRTYRIDTRGIQVLPGKDPTNEQLAELFFINFSDDK